MVIVSRESEDLDEATGDSSGDGAELLVLTDGSKTPGGRRFAGAGIGLLNPVIADVAVSVVPKERSGMAAGINDTFRQVGIAVGIAAWGAIFLGAGASRTQELAGNAVNGDQARHLVESVSSGSVEQAAASAPGASPDLIRSAAEQGFLHGLNEILLLGAILSLLGSVVALWLVRESEIEPEGATLTAPRTGRIVAAWRAPVASSAWRS